jgi:type IV pilus assembly protein PilX
MIVSPIKNSALSRPSHAQKGVALIISLVLLLVMTLVGLSGIRMVTSQERMVSYTYDRSVAFQAAEASLRIAEDSIQTVGLPTPAAGAACGITGTTPQLMICGAPATNTTPRWLDNSFSSWTASPTTVTSVVSPQYFIEYLGDTFPCSTDPSASAALCKRYRITVKADAGAGRANVMLQSVYAFGSD